MPPLPVAAAALVFALLPAAARAEPPTLFPPGDFVEYWAAGRVHLEGGDPYDPAAVLPLQQEASDGDRTLATMLWTPPWTLPLYWPFAVLPARHAHLTWVLTQLLAVLVSADLLWRVYGGPMRRGGLAVPYLLALSFGPVIWMVGVGQNTGFLLLGMAGFVFCRKHDRPWPAGVFAALTATKPHVLALFGVALVLDGLTRRGWRSLAAGVGVLAGSAALSLVPNPGVFADFADALGRPMSGEIVPVSHWQVPTASFRLRVWLADDLLGGRRGEMFWVQFVPCLLGCLAVVPYCWRRRGAWCWPIEAPRLVFASVLLAPYGAWVFDLTVLLVPVIQSAAWVGRAGRPLFAAALAVGLLLATAAAFDPRLVGKLHDMIWFTPVVLGLYLAAGWACGRPRELECP